MHEIGYWLRGQRVQNFGDFLTELLLRKLFAPVAVAGTEIRLVGSCIDDMFYPETREHDERFVFWGCGLRTPNGLSDGNRKRSEILAVRGPLSRSALRLGSTVPFGDPGLLLPALYQPNGNTLAGKAVCVPHFLNEQGDDELLEQSGCNAVVRTNLPNSKNALTQFIDALVSADFLLCASLHAAIVAAAYGRPFAFWDSGTIDLPFKWEDFAASINIPSDFCKTLDEARLHYHEKIEPNLKLPSLWDLVCSAPLVVRPDALLQVLRADLALRGESSDNLTGYIETWVEQQDTVGELSGYPVRLGDPPRQWGAWRLVDLEESLDDVRRRASELDSEGARLRKDLEDSKRLNVERGGQIGELQSTTASLVKERDRLTRRITAGEQTIEQLNEMLETKVAEVEGVREELAEARAETAEVRGALDNLHAEIARKEQERQEEEARRAAEEAAYRPELDPAQRDTALDAFRRAQPQPRRELLSLIPGTNPRALRSRWRSLRALVSSRKRSAMLLARSPVFDERWYLAQNPDVAELGTNPVHHYLANGAAEGRDPGPAFDTDYYLNHNPDVAGSGMTPLYHYLRHGWTEGRAPNRFFDPGWYLAQNPDVASAGLEPLSHYLEFGAAEGRAPHPELDAIGYLVLHPGVAASGMNPMVHALRAPAGEARPQEPEPAAAGPEPTPPPRPVAPPLPLLLTNRDGPRVLIVDSVFPRPDRDSGSVTARHLIDMFLDFGWQVTFFADADPRNEYCEQLEKAGVRCPTAPAIHSLDELVYAEGETFNLVMLFRVHSGGRHYELVRRQCENAKIVFETVDLHFLREERQARLANDRKALNRAHQVRERELYLVRQSDLAIVVSEFENELLTEEVPGSRVMVLPLILDCPGRKTPYADREGICFVGGYLHQPNIDAVNYFLDDIWPLVLERVPNCTFYIVGSDLPPELAARGSSNIVPIGYVEDLDAYLNGVRLSVAPLRFGAGIKGKIGSSLANGLPCVASPVAVEGMGLIPDESIAVAGTPEEFAAQIERIYTHGDAWLGMSDAGYQFAAELYSLESGRERIAAMLRQLDLPAPDRANEHSDRRAHQGSR